MAPADSRTLHFGEPSFLHLPDPIKPHQGAFSPSDSREANDTDGYILSQEILVRISHPTPLLPCPPFNNEVECQRVVE
jgi:hypothetical protein